MKTFLLILFYFCNLLNCDILFNDSIIKCWNDDNNPTWYCHDNKCFEQNSEYTCDIPPCCSVNKDGYIISPKINITNYINIGIRLHYTSNNVPCYLKYINNYGNYTILTLPHQNQPIYNNTNLSDLNDQSSIQFELMSYDGECTWDNFIIYGTEITSVINEYIISESPTMEPTHTPTNTPTYVPTIMSSSNPTNAPTMYPTGYQSVSTTFSPELSSKGPTYSPTNNPTIFAGLISEGVVDRENFLYRKGDVKIALLGVLTLLSIILILLWLLYIVLYKRYQYKFHDNVKNIKHTQTVTSSQVRISVKDKSVDDGDKSPNEGAKTVEIDKPIGSLNTDDANYIIDICEEINVKANTIIPKIQDTNNDVIFGDKLTMGIIDEDIEKDNIVSDMIIDDIHVKTSKHIQWESISTMNEHRIQSRNITNTYEFNSETLSVSQPKVNSELDSISNAKHRNGSRLQQLNKSESDIIKLMLND